MQLFWVQILIQMWMQIQIFETLNINFFRLGCSDLTVYSVMHLKVLACLITVVLSCY